MAEGTTERFEGAKDNPPQYCINVQDNARVCVAALIYGDVQGERLFIFSAPYNWNDILDIFRKHYPDHKFVENIPDIPRDLSKVGNERAQEHPKRFGRPGWTSLDQ